MSHSHSPATWELPSPIIISPLAAEQHHWSDSELTAELKDNWPISFFFFVFFSWAEGISYSFSTLQSQNQFSKLYATTYFPSICSRSEWRRGSGMRRLVGGASSGCRPGDSLPCSSLSQSHIILGPRLHSSSSLYDIYFWTPGGADAVCCREGNARRAGGGQACNIAIVALVGVLRRKRKDCRQWLGWASSPFLFRRRELTFLLDTAAATFSTRRNFKNRKKKAILKLNSSAGADEHKDSQSVFFILHKGREVILSQTPVRNADVSHAALFAAN